MTRFRLLLALLVAVAVGLAAGWIAKPRVLSGWQERGRAAVLEILRKAQREASPARH